MVIHFSKSRSFKLVRITRIVTPTSAEIAKTKLLYPVKAIAIKINLTAIAHWIVSV